MLLLKITSAMFVTTLRLEPLGYSSLHWSTRTRIQRIPSRSTKIRLLLPPVWSSCLSTGAKSWHAEDTGRSSPNKHQKIQLIMR
ncbi:hypothetical protein GN244_ATG11102 [Phytophthora infestans]|uniref:Uncharacterized protein n=1 Tax=Phytophthora infestans TaxID=4787 RepID=A0A833WC02_PHYIN|nr:hypothetical protein GN244_ATG11102 [Phytophthora infestans]